MKRLMVSLALIAGLGLAAQAYAQCGSSKDTGLQASGDKAKPKCCAKDAKACDKGKEVVATCMPLMKYKVGDDTTACPKQAADLAEKNKDAKTTYIVNDKEYTDKGEALTAYQGVLNDYLSTATVVRYVVGQECVACPMAADSLAKKNHETVKYRVATFNYDDHKKAQKAAQVAAEAAEKVTWKMVVDGAEYTCEKSAQKACQGSAAKDGGNKKCEYVVGETRTCCRSTAKVELAKAKIMAAYRALDEFNTDEVARH